MRMRKNYDALSDDDKKEMDDVFNQWWSYFNNHTDEMRNFNSENGFVQKPNTDWDIPFVLVVGNYNSSGSINDLAQAYMDWATKPGVENGLQLGGGATTHFKGGGADVQFFGAFKNIKEFAESVSGQGTDNPEARSKFWNLVLAVCIQHEIDHLEGKLFVDYLSPLKRQRIRTKLKKQRA